MPAVNRKTGGFTFYNIFKGKFTRKAPDDYTGEDLVERINKEGKAVRERHFSRLEDILLVDIKEEVHDEYGKSYNFFFIDGNEYIKVKVSASSSVASGLLVRLENILIEKSIDIELYFFPKDDKNPKDRTTLNIFQDDNKVAKVYTKDAPGKLPPPVQVEINNEKVWDWTEQLKYWSSLIKSMVLVLPGVHTESAEVAQEQDTTPSQATTPPTQPAQQTAPMTQEGPDDLPF